MTLLTARYAACIIVYCKLPAPVAEPHSGDLQHAAPMIRRIAHATLAALLLASVASCGGDTVSGVPATPRGSLSLPLLGGTTSPSFLQCDPPAAADSVSGIIGALGGTLQLGGTSVVIPQNAVLTPTAFTLTVPASRMVKISVKAAGTDHYVFLQPVLVTIDYGRCASGLSVLDPLTAWHIDEDTNAPLENMLGVDLRLLHTVTFYTGHLSGYAVAD